MISLILGGIGILLPGLPTTPFVLLAAGLLLRSSDSLYRKLLKNRIFGKYIHRYMKHKGMTLRSKIGSITLMWSMIAFSVYRVDSLHFRIAVILVGLIGTYVMGFRLKTLAPFTDGEDSLSQPDGSPPED